MSFPIRNTASEVRVIGRVGNVRRSESNGKKVANISVAFQRSWMKKDESGNQTGEFSHQTQWFEFACWELAATKAENISKGDVVECEFNLADVRPDTYDKEGETKASIKVGRANVLLLSKKGESETGVNAPAPIDEPVMAEEVI